MKRIILLSVLILAFAVLGSAQSATVIAENANLRGTPSASGTVVETLSSKSRVDVIKQQGAWFLVQSTEYVGWIHGNTIRLDLATYPAPYVKPAPIKISTAPQTPPENTESTIQSEPSSTTKPESEASVPSTTATTTASEDQSETRVATGLCKDGTFTYSDERQGSCSGHGGIDRWYADGDAPVTTTAPSSSGGPVHVKGYYRKDGTYVRPHTRKSPRR